ncbi:uncharacterized protein LOC108675265, partial [Hyalella azteca]|uniref:Uncharacterized protein LOC108675265 n=1 Tax=Hyalella azteca TaxID=294128 RepID=A0A8B7NYG8_HYAAZ
MDVLPRSLDVDPASGDVATRSLDVAQQSVDEAPKSLDFSKGSVKIKHDSPDATEKLLLSSSNFVKGKTPVSTQKQRKALSYSNRSNLQRRVSGRSAGLRLPGSEYFKFSRRKRSRSRRLTRNRVERDGGSLWNDFNNGCLSAVRVFGHLLPLPDIADKNNSSSKNMRHAAGSVTSYANVIAGCTSPSVCTNTSCPPPLTCGHSWGLATCGCAVGEELSRDGTACIDVDECRYDPCLNLGVCVNTQPGYGCACGPTLNSLASGRVR